LGIKQLLLSSVLFMAMDVEAFLVYFLRTKVEKVYSERETLEVWES